MKKVVKHTFISSFAQKNGNHYQFNFLEPVRNIIGGRISAVFIKNTLLTLTSYIYLLKTDGVLGSRTMSNLNGIVDPTVFVIPNPQNNNTCLWRTSEDNSFYLTPMHDLNGITFSLHDETGAFIIPPTGLWSFTVEIEYLING
jgi:hypothetical protein